MTVIRQTTNVSQYGDCGTDLPTIQGPEYWAEVAEQWAIISCDCADRAEQAIEDLDELVLRAEAAAAAAENAASEAAASAANASTDAASAAASKDAAAISAAEALAAVDVVKGYRDEAEISAKLSHDWAVGPTGTSPDTPSDTNNSKYYKDESEKILQLMQEAAQGLYHEQGVFVPSASKEYPDTPDFPTIWFLKPSDPTGYLYTTGTAAGFTALYADLLMYSKAIDEFNVLPQSLLHVVQNATETDIGVARLSTAAEALAGTDDTTIMTPLKTGSILGSINPESIGALPDDKYAAPTEMGGLKARVDVALSTLYISFDGSDV